MNRTFIFDKFIDPNEWFCLHLKTGKWSIAHRDTFIPICNHSFWDVDALKKWYLTEWHKKPIGICPSCEKPIVLITVPHANCSGLTDFEEYQHQCDFFAEDAANIFAKEFRKRGYQIVLVDNANRRPEYDENRPQSYDSEMRTKVKRKLEEGNVVFSLEVHSYPPTDLSTQNLHFYVLDNFADLDSPISNRVKKFVRLAQNDKIEIDLLSGDKQKNYMQNLFRNYQVDSFLLEVNERNRQNPLFETMVEKMVSNITNVFLPK